MGGRAQAVNINYVLPKHYREHQAGTGKTHDTINNKHKICKLSMRNNLHSNINMVSKAEKLDQYSGKKKKKYILYV